MNARGRPAPAARMRACLQRVATGPELSKSLSREAAADAMDIILDGRVDPVQAGIYLIALRMKRETDDENLGSLDALLRSRRQHSVRCRQLIDIADPFNGCARGIPATPFLGATLAACGLNACACGLRAVGPKYGITLHRVYAAAGIPVELSPAQAAKRIADRRIGWAYLDQAGYAPKLHRLTELRAKMVKRSCITTLEVLLGPLRATGETHLLTGYVHKAYPPVYTLLARHAGYDGAIIVRGVEGGCVPSLSQPAKFFAYTGGGPDREIRITPRETGIDRPARMIPIPPRFLRETPVYPGSARDGIVSPLDCEKAAAHCVELGEQALSGAPGPMRDSLVYAAAICLLHCGRAAGLREGAEQARTALDTGAAMRHFTAARQ